MVLGLQRIDDSGGPEFMSFGSGTFNVIDFQGIAGLIDLLVSSGDWFYKSRESEIAASWLFGDESFGNSALNIFFLKRRVSVVVGSSCKIVFGCVRDESYLWLRDTSYFLFG